jgi:hypothetical protein
MVNYPMAQRASGTTMGNSQQSTLVVVTQAPRCQRFFDLFES